MFNYWLEQSYEVKSWDSCERKWLLPVSDGSNFFSFLVKNAVLLQPNNVFYYLMTLSTTKMVVTVCFVMFKLQTKIFYANGFLTKIFK